MPTYFPTPQGSSGSSGSYSFTVARDDIIREAMLNIGKLGENETPTAQEVTDCARKLNMMVNTWQAKQDFAPGLKIWTRRHSTMFLSSTTGVYNAGPTGDNWTSSPVFNNTTAVTAASATSWTCTNTGINAGDYIGLQLDSGALFWTTVSTVVGSTGVTVNTGPPSQASSGNYVYSYTTKAQRPLVIETAYLRDNQGSDTPLNIGTLQDYDLLPSKMQTGYIADPTFIYYEAQLGNGVIYTDCNGAQDVTKQIHCSYMESIQGFVNPTDNPEYPQEWFLALCWGLTKQIAPMFNVPFTKDMSDNLTEALVTAREAYSDNSNLYFQPGVY